MRQVSPTSVATGPHISDWGLQVSQHTPSSNLLGYRADQWVTKNVHTHRLHDRNGSEM